MYKNAYKRALCAYGKEIVLKVKYSVLSHLFVCELHLVGKQPLSIFCIGLIAA
jgi:hypothetical protein